MTRRSIQAQAVPRVPHRSTRISGVILFSLFLAGLRFVQEVESFTIYLPLQHSKILNQIQNQKQMQRPASHMNVHKITNTQLRASESNKDDEDKRSDDPNYLYYRPQSRPKPQGGEWAYTEPNIRRSAQTFLNIRSIGGSECTNDVYVRSPDRFEYWYVGKIARTDGTVSLPKAVSCVWNMVEEHACRLRPVELGREFGKMEVCVAKGDTELEMSQATAAGVDTGFGLEGLQKMEEMTVKKMEKFVDGIENVTNLEVGFMAEVVTNTGSGFYIVRDDLGKIMQ
jgi:hypothetical protein